jgi:hypothetical protein
MSQDHSGKQETMTDARLPRRDWFLLPMTGLLTIGLLAGSTELTARRVFTFTKTEAEDCMVLTDPSTGTRGIPGCDCWEKKGESQLVEYRFNSSGYRADSDFGAKPPGTYRIVMVGSSYAFGMRVPMNEALATLLPAELSKQTGHKVELFDEAMAGMGGGPHSVALRFNDALAAKPDMILWMLTPWDIQQGAAMMPAKGQVPLVGGSFISRAWSRVRKAVTASSSKDAIDEILSYTRTATLLRHYLYQSQSLYLNSSLGAAALGPQALVAEPSAEYESQLRDCDTNAAEIEARASAAGVPLVAVLVPNRAQAAMISIGTWPNGYDPFQLGRSLRAIVVGHGGIYIDILPDFRTVPDPERYYYAVDGHLDPGGNALVSQMVAKALISGAVAALHPSPNP